jgi:hypothetical protein
MKTHWGDIDVADAHVHFFSHTFFKALAAQKGQPDGVDELIAQLAGMHLQFAMPNLELAGFRNSIATALQNRF